MATLTVEVEVNSVWTEVEANAARIPRRFGRGGGATFVKRNAAVADRLTCRMHRRVRISIVDGLDTIWFIGSIAKPRVVQREKSTAWDLVVECDELAVEAKAVYNPSPIEYPQAIEAVTEVSLVPTEDAHVDQSDPTNPHGTGVYLKVFYDSTSDVFGLMKWDLSSIPITSRILLAHLVLRSVKSEATAATPGNLFVKFVDASWSEATVTWNTKPTTASEVATPLTVDTEDTGDNNGKEFTNASGDFVNDGVRVGDTIANLTDGSEATVVLVSATQIVCDGLAGGTDNDFDIGDQVEVRRTLSTVALPVTARDVGHFIGERRTNAYVPQLLDLTGFVRLWAGVSASQTNNGVQLELEPRTGGNPLTAVSRFFASSETTVVDYRPSLKIQHATPVKVTDVVKDAWETLWPEVNTTMVQDFADVDIPTAGLDEDGNLVGTIFPELATLFDFTEQMRELLPNFRWWLDYNGTTIFLRFEQEASSSFAITDSDILARREMEPTNERIVNFALVQGPTAGGVDEEGAPSDAIPIYGLAKNQASIAVFGEQFEFVESNTADNLERARLEAEGYIADRAWEYWRMNVVLSPDYASHNDIEPGSQIGLNMATIGVDGTNFPVNYIAEEVIDDIDGQRWERSVTLIEVDPGLFVGSRL